ncbi:unnamed protein product, partial [Urochloa humidicola]
DGDRELVPAGGEGQDEGELHAAQVNQDPNQVSEDQPTNFVFEGSSLEEMVVNPWPYQLPPGWTIEWDTTGAE